MGLHRITIEGYTDEEAAVTAGRAALIAARSSGVSVTKAEVVVQMFQGDKKSIDLLAAPAPAAAEESAPQAP